MQGIPMVASSPVRHDSPLNLHGLEVTSYQPPWKALSDFALHADLDNNGSVNTHTPAFQHLVNQVFLFLPLFASSFLRIFYSSFCLFIISSKKINMIKIIIYFERFFSRNHIFVYFLSYSYSFLFSQIRKFMFQRFKKWHLSTDYISCSFSVYPSFCLQIFFSFYLFKFLAIKKKFHSFEDSFFRLFIFLRNFIFLD